MASDVAPTSSPRRPPGRPRARSQRGIALLLVLLFLPLVFAIVAELAYDSEVEHRSALNVKDQAVIEYGIDGEFELALARLRYDKRQNEVDSEFDDWAEQETRSDPESGVSLSTVIADEGGKFNLARLVTGTEVQQARAKEILVRILDFYREETPVDVSLVDAQELVEKIVAHLRRESAPGQIPHPKTNPPGVPLLLDQLVFVDPKRMPDLLVDVRTRDRRVAPGLHRYLTAFGTTKVNLNTAPLLVLQAFFSDPRDRDYAQGIIDRRDGAAVDEAPAPSTSGMGGTTPTTPDPRDPQGFDEEQGNPFSDVNQITEVEGLTMEVLQRNQIEPSADFDVKSDFFSIRVVGETNATQRIELYVVERVAADGFRFLLHQERTDPLLTDDVPR
jgi:type II secretory pathway component PulK